VRLLVVDASALAEYLLGTVRGGRVAELITRSGVDLHAPALVDIEVAAVLRRGLLRDELEPGRARDAVSDLLDLPLMRHGHRGRVERILELRENFSAYDATYLTLAERLGGCLVTTDTRLARATRKTLDLPVESVEPG